MDICFGNGYCALKTEEACTDSCLERRDSSRGHEVHLYHLGGKSVRWQRQTCTPLQGRGKSQWKRGRDSRLTLRRISFCRTGGIQGKTGQRIGGQTTTGSKKKGDGKHQQKRYGRVVFAVGKDSKEKRARSKGPGWPQVKEKHRE